MEFEDFVTDRRVPSPHDDGMAIRNAALRRSGERAAEHWEQFPYYVEPRPLVLLEGPVLLDAGFATGDAKMAFYRGEIEADGTVPDEPISLLRGAQAPGPRLSRNPLRVLRAFLSEAPFRTDRGKQICPAWHVEAADTDGVIFVMTEQARRRCWAPPSTTERFGPHALQSAVMDPNTRSLTVVFVGGPAPLFEYDADVIERDAAVAIVPLGRFTRQLPPGTAISAVGQVRQVRVRLRDPLGSRVLVNLDGSPVEVT